MSTLVLAISAVLLATSLAAQEEHQVWNFDMVRIGALPGELVSKVGQWKVVLDLTAPSRPKALAQVAKSAGSTFNVILRRDSLFKDIDLSVKMKAIAGEDGQGGGLVWRAQGVRNYYLARYNPLEANYSVYKVVKGRRTQLQSAQVMLNPGWHTLRVTMEANHIQCYLDGNAYLDVSDSTLTAAGQMGLWSKADAQSHFDDLRASVP